MNYVNTINFSYDCLRGTISYMWGMGLYLCIAQVDSNWGCGGILLCHEAYGLCMQDLYVC